LNPSLVLGSEAVRPIEMAAAYATVADGGIYHTPRFINRVVDRTGTVIYNGEGPGRRVFSAQVADEALLALRATVQYGTGVAAALTNADVAGKTGTTENSVDAWFNGVTPTLAASVWLGDPKGEVPMYVNGVEVFGADYPTQIWHDVMQFALNGVPYSAFPAPDPSLMPPIKYIFSPALERDDLLSHGGVGPTSCVWDGSIVPCPTTTTTTTTTLPPGPKRVPTQAGGVPLVLGHQAAVATPGPTSKTPTASPGVTKGPSQ
jgi:membrane peptidoglycan carboxypeptidase